MGSPWKPLQFTMVTTFPNLLLPSDIEIFVKSEEFFLLTTFSSGEAKSCCKTWLATAYI